MFELPKIINKLWKQYLRNEDGQFAVVTAMVGIPLIMVAGYSLDINHAVSKKANIQAALDTAALASVIPDNLTVSERETFAQDVFNKNYLGNIPTTLKLSVSRERVDIIGTATVPTLFGGIIGMDSVTVGGKSSAVLTKSDTVCVLALDPTGERAIEFKNQAIYNSPACSVQVNSTNNLAVVSDVVVPPVAKTFCTAGLSRGQFKPYIKHACSPIADPYKDLQIPEPASSCDSNRLVEITGNNISAGSISVLESQLATSTNGEAVIPTGSTLSPGVYCKGLSINGADVTLLPGVYHVWGNLDIGSFAAVYGDRVTIILKGTKNRLIIRDGAQVSLRAPETGLTAGLVFWQTHLDFWTYVLGRETKPPKGVTAVSEISSGGGLKIIGTAYFPNHELLISSNSPVASQSPATSFIAYRLKFAGKSNTQVHVDHEAGGIPPMLPRSDEGARLVK